MREIPLPFTMGLNDEGGFSFVLEPSSFQPGFWRFALFGVVMVLTLRYMRNGLLYPILEWFKGRDVVMQETVRKRDELRRDEEAFEAGTEDA